MGKRIPPSLRDDIELSNPAATAESLRQHSNKQLSEMLKSKQYPSSGAKDTLVDRLVCIQYPAHNPTLLEELEKQKSLKEMKVAKKLRSELRLDNAKDLAKKVVAVGELGSESTTTPAPVTKPFTAVPSKSGSSGNFSGSASLPSIPLPGKTAPFASVPSSKFTFDNSGPFLPLPKETPCYFEPMSPAAFQSTPPPEPETLETQPSTETVQGQDEYFDPVSSVSPETSDSDPEPEGGDDEPNPLFDREFAEYRKLMLASQSCFANCMKSYSQSTSYLLRAAKAAKRRTTPAKVLKSCRDLSASQVSLLSEDFGFSTSQIENIAALMKAGNMIQFIGHIARLFKLDPHTGGIRKVGNFNAFVCRITSGTLSMADAQKELVSWARHERFRTRSTTPTSAVEILE